MEMELRHIRYFLAIAGEGSFTRAAEKVGIGQPPLSLQIKDLEREVGARLFHRHPHGAELTAAGRAFHEQVAQIPQQVELAIRSAQRADRGELGALRIGFTASAHFNGALASIGRFSTRYPDVELTLTEGNSAALGAAVSSGMLDLAFLRPWPGMDAGLQTRLVAEEPLIAALPAKNPLAKKRGLRLSDLKGESFIVTPREVGSSVHDAVLDACRAAGFEARVRQTAPQLGSVVSLIAAGAGVSLVPDSIRRLQVDGVVFRELPDIVGTVRLVLVWRRIDTSPFVANFVDAVRADDN